MVLEQLDIYIKKENEPPCLSYIIHQNSLKIDQRPKCQFSVKMMMLLQENLCGIGLGQDFFIRTHTKNMNH